MLIVKNYGGSYQGWLVSTCKRGAACWMKGRANSNGNRLEFCVPHSSVEAGRACYLVTWENHDYTNVTGGSTSAAMDHHVSSAAMKATFHYGGSYRTNNFYMEGAGADSGERTVATPFSGDPLDASTPFYMWPVNTVAGSGVTMGRLDNRGETVGGFDSDAAAYRNSNFIVTGYDNDSSDAAYYGRGPWIEIMALKNRVDAGYVATAVNDVNR